MLSEFLHSFKGIFINNRFLGVGYDLPFFFGKMNGFLNFEADKGAFEMADVLIISDFCFSKPSPKTNERMSEHRAKGTKFYGLHIGYYSATYDNILDKIWRI